jgi:hypothetical protein
MADGSKVLGIVGPSEQAKEEGMRRVMLVTGHTFLIQESLLRGMLAQGDNLVGSRLWKVRDMLKGWRKVWGMARVSSVASSVIWWHVDCRPVEVREMLSGSRLVQM